LAFAYFFFIVSYTVFIPCCWVKNARG